MARSSSNLAERADRRVAHLGVRVVHGLEQRVPGRLHLQATDDAGGAGANGRIVVVERFEQSRDRGFRQFDGRRRPNRAKRIDRFDPYFLIVVVDGLKERVDELDGHGLGPDRERAELERRRRPALRSHLDDERHALLGRNRFNQKEGQLGIDRLELNLVDLVADDGRERRHRFRVPGLAQQTHCADTNLRIGIAEVSDHVLEFGRLLSDRGNRRDNEDCGNEDHQPYKSGHGRSSGGPVIVTEAAEGEAQKTAAATTSAQKC